MYTQPETTLEYMNEEKCRWALEEIEHKTLVTDFESTCT